MRFSTLLEEVEMQIRALVCSKCPRRPWDLRPENAGMPWICQRGCPIFQMLPSLISRTELSGLPRCAREQIMRQVLQAAGRRESSRVRATLLNRNAQEVARIAAGLADMEK
jgi:hypothetical protein